MNTDARRYVILIFFLVIGVIYSIRLFYMQVVDDSWTLRAQEIAEKRHVAVPPRGIVKDRNGKKIVINKTYYNLMMCEKEIKHFDTVAFAKLIGWTPEKVKYRFKEIYYEEGFDKNPKTKVRNVPRYQKMRKYAFVKEMTTEEMAVIAPYLGNFPGFFEEITSMRSYPYANAANILGYVSEVNGQEVEEDRFYRSGDNIGRAGLERFYETDLRGRKGVHYIVTSAMNNAIERAEAAFTELLNLAPQSLQVLRLYADFCLLVLNNSEKASLLLADAQRVEEAAVKETRSKDSGASLRILSESSLDIMDDDTAVITISGKSSNLGTILSANSVACRLLGYARW